MPPYFFMTFWRSKLHILLIYIVLQSYEVIVQRAKGSKRTKYVSWLNMNFYLLTGYIYYVYKNFWICKCYVLGNQMDATLQKKCFERKKEQKMITIRKRYIFRPWTWIFSQSISQNLVWMVSLNKGHWCRGNSMGIRVPNSRIMFAK